MKILIKMVYVIIDVITYVQIVGLMKQMLKVDYAMIVNGINIIQIKQLVEDA